MRRKTKKKQHTGIFDTNRRKRRNKSRTDTESGTIREESEKHKFR